MAKELLVLAIENSFSNLGLATEEAELARRLLLKFNIRFDWELRRYYCHGCKLLIVPGVNARVRLGHGRKAIYLTCLGCGRVNRKIIGRQA